MGESSLLLSLKLSPISLNSEPGHRVEKQAYSVGKHSHSGRGLTFPMVPLWMSGPLWSGPALLIEVSESWGVRIYPAAFY